MKLLKFVGCLVLLVLFLAVGLSGSSQSDSLNELDKLPRLTFRPTVPKLEYSIYRTAPVLVAGVFGRSTGCVDADFELITDVAHAAIEVSLDPRILAATVAVESACNQYAISSKGAVGLGQVVPRVWRSEFDFAGADNLFNVQDNLRVSAKILSDLIAEYGVPEAVQRYQGLGVGGDLMYTQKILTLARR